MTAREGHRCRVFGSPWEGVYGTGIESERHYGRHWHATFGIGLVEHGAHRSSSGRGMVDAYAGDLITTNPGEVHDGRPLGGPSRRWRIVHVDPAVMAWLGGAGAEITRPVIRDPVLAASLRRLFIRLDGWSSGDGDRLGCEEALAELGGLLLERHSTPAPAAQGLERRRDHAGPCRRIRERLADELLDPPTLDELAAMVGWSKYQLLRRFRQAYGVPPHAWLLLQRTEKARRLIREGAGLAAAAAACGFADQSHLTRLFVRQFGFTPGAWQRAAGLQ